MEGYNFDDIMLVPRKCILQSRADADTSCKLGNRTFKIPLMPSNMPAILDEKLAVEFAKRNYFYVMHRYNVDAIEFSRKMRSLGLFVSISIGVKQESLDLVDKLKAENLVPEYITVDIAHGHSEEMHRTLEHIRKVMGNDTFIIAGNVATPEGLQDLENWGADAVKVGIGPGYVCSTSIRTGFGTRKWQLAAIKNCAAAAKKTVIADGGCRQNSDIVKCIHGGADWVMSGYFYAGCTESPGKTIVKEDVVLKTYYGNASSENKQSNHRVEGISVHVPCRGSIFDKLEEIHQDLQSAISYAGGTKMNDVRNCDCVFVRGSDG